MGRDIKGAGLVEDREIIAGYKRGDAHAIAEVDRWIDVVMRDGFCMERTHWDDLRQEVRIRILNNLRRGSFDGRSALRTYVHRIAKNVCIDFTRRAHRVRETSPAGERPSPATGAIAGAESELVARDLLEKILAGVTPQDRLMIRLVFAERCSYAEVAARLAMPEGTVKSRVHRCKDRLLARRRRILRQESHD